MPKKVWSVVMGGEREGEGVCAEEKVWRIAPVVKAGVNRFKGNG